MEVLGQRPQLIVALPLIGGTGGQQAKMSKSAGNQIGLAEQASEIYGKVMSIPDSLTVAYLRAWTEWLDEEIGMVEDRLAGGTVHPADLKRILAGEMVAALCGVEEAAKARASFTAQFARRQYTGLTDLVCVPLDEVGDRNVADVLVGVVRFAPSYSAARRLTRQNGLRLVAETDAGQRTVVLGEQALTVPLREVAALRRTRPAHRVRPISKPAGGSPGSSAAPGTATSKRSSRRE